MKQIARFLAGLMLIAASAGASAQVHRCKDASGKTHYSDKPCAVSGQTGQQIERQYTPEEIEAQRDQAYEAQLRKQNRQMAEQEREWAEQRLRAMQPQPAPEVRHSGNDWQRRKDLQNAQTSASSITNNGGRFDQAAEAQRAKERQEEARKQAAAHPMITNCDPGFCYDTLGRTYHRNGPNFLNGPNGINCTRAGTSWACN